MPKSFRSTTKKQDYVLMFLMVVVVIYNIFTVGLAGVIVGIYSAFEVSMEESKKMVKVLSLDFLHNVAVIIF